MRSVAISLSEFVAQDFAVKICSMLKYWGILAYIPAGIPRLINIICDNALLLAYAAGKKTVTTEIVQEVARDLGLANLPEAKPSAASAQAAFPDLDTQDTAVISHVQPAAPRLQRRNRSLAWVPMGMALALVALGGAAATLYSQQIKGYLAQVPSPETRAPNNAVCLPKSFRDI